MTYKNNKKIALLLAIEERDQIASDFLIARLINNSLTILSTIASDFLS